VRRRLFSLLTARSLLPCTAVVALLCLRPFSYSRAVQSCKASNTYVQEFERTFPDSSHSIGYFMGTHGRPTWKSEALLYERYTLTMEIPVRLNTLHNRISSFEQPRFQLLEVERVSSMPGGQMAIEHGRTQLKFGVREWQRVVASGDLDQLGIHIDKDRPVAGLKDQWRQSHP
jgi:hypothetical protein